MGSYRNENVKVYRYYYIIDVDTGEILKNVNKKEYTTVNTEKIITNERFNNSIRNEEYRRENTYRYVKHTGQQRIEI